jgi:hypothetical protein
MIEIMRRGEKQLLFLHEDIRVWTLSQKLDLGPKCERPMNIHGLANEYKNTQMEPRYPVCNISSAWMTARPSFGFVLGWLRLRLRYRQTAARLQGDCNMLLVVLSQNLNRTSKRTVSTYVQMIQACSALQLSLTMCKSQQTRTAKC